MSERTQVVAATLAGAAVGGLIGYLYFTSGGRRLRSELEPRLTEASRDIVRMRTAISDAFAALEEGRRSLQRLAAQLASPPSYEPPAEADGHFV